MASSRSYGDILRRSRERAGIDVVTMARKLHIRPDILKAIESSDFSRMPARGYSRNMIRAYARQLGLDEMALSEQYLDEIHMYETGSSRVSRKPSGRSGGYPARDRGYGTDSYSDSRNLSRRAKSYSDDYYDDRYSRTSSYGRQSDRGRTSGQLGTYPRDSYPEAGSRSRELSDRYRSSRPYQPSRSNPSRNFADSQERSIRFSSGNASGARRVPQRSHLRDQDIVLPQNQHSYSDIYGGNSQSKASSSLNVPLMILIGIIAIAVIIAVVVLFNSGTKSTEEIPNIPIAGYTDTSEPVESVTQNTVAKAEPTSATFTYKIASGGRSWIEITENGSSKATFSGAVDGPKEETFTVTDSLTFRTANPTPVSLYVDGDEVKLTKSSGSDYYTYTVDFASILAQWREENDPLSASSSSSSSSASSSSASLRASSSSSASSSSTRT